MSNYGEVINLTVEMLLSPDGAEYHVYYQELC